MQYKIKLPIFEGPFDLLYHLIREKEIDIWSVSISEITEQYLDYLQLMDDFNLEIASDFLLMAATLLRLKSKLLLPVQNDPLEENADDLLLSINSSEELIKRILEYRLYKTQADFLRTREEEQQKIFFRSTNQPRVLYINQDTTFLFQEDLGQILIEMLRKQMLQEKFINQKPEIILSDEMLLKEKLNKIIYKLREKKEAVYLDSLYETKKIGEILITFVAVLELARQKKVNLWQQRSFGPVLVELKRRNKKKGQ